MESQDISPPHVDASRPSLGFPLGTALLLIIIFSLSGIFSCCYHWDKLRSLRLEEKQRREPAGVDARGRGTQIHSHAVSV
ncbi:Hydroxyproline-rich glycoprotein family protein [Senna tora]|uniref:Hydroxyproline-rich glycoprotein family protein n=1 Tax=Senna tora TaxID=362788 RepID=A0A834TZ32_9FABA|nr:Hydroxyproline-rich glycoprotein family protein [Senna tora]